VATAATDYVWRRGLFGPAAFYRDPQRLGRCRVGHRAETEGYAEKLTRRSVMDDATQRRRVRSVAEQSR